MSAGWWTLTLGLCTGALAASALWAIAWTLERQAHRDTRRRWHQQRVALRTVAEMGERP